MKIKSSRIIYLAIILIVIIISIIIAIMGIISNNDLNNARNDATAMMKKHESDVKSSEIKSIKIKDKKRTIILKNGTRIKASVANKSYDWVRSNDVVKYTEHPVYITKEYGNFVPKYKIEKTDKTEYSIKEVVRK